MCVILRTFLAHLTFSFAPKHAFDLTGRSLKGQKTLFGICLSEIHCY